MGKFSDSRSWQIILSLLLFWGLVCTVGAALALQYIGGFLPCELCLLERMPYYAGAVLMVIAFLAACARRPRLAWLMFILTAALMFYDFGLSVYHVGVELHYWPGPSACSSANAGALPARASDLMAGLNMARIIPCDVAGGYIFGISFAGWNAIACLGFAIFAAFAAWFPFRVGRE